MGTPNSQARASRGFAALSPLAKLAIWFAAVAALAAGVQGGAWALGLPFNILLESGGGRGVLLGLALGCLLVMMAADGRSVADYGLAIARSWQKVLLGGFLIGAVVYSCLYALIVVPQAGLPQIGSLTAPQFFRAGFSAMTAFPVAMTQQIVFGGYLLSILRQRYGRVTAVLIPAALFALLRRMDNPAMLIAPNGYPLVVGLFLVATLLGVLRLKTGGILLPAGILAGCIFMRRILRKTWLVAVTGPAGNVELLPPAIDPVQSPLMWALVIAAIVLCWFFLKEQTGKQAAAASKGIDTSFKKVFPLSNTSMLAPLDVWLARLADARFRVGLKYLPRLIAILLVSSVNTILSLPERLFAPLVVRWHRVNDPVFIVGVHRSGTTHLHNLLALDPQFCTPRTHQILNPAGFFTGSWVIAPLLGAFLPWKRPMDAVRFHIFTPQEDEYVLQGLSRTSPYWAMTFPRRGAQYDRYILPQGFAAAELRAWKRHLLVFLGKLTFWSRRRPLLKNPYNTGRAAVLAGMFPKARFIHISRHPYDVYRSNMHMAREGHVVNQLQDPDEADCYQTRFLANYRAMETAYYRAARRMPADRAADVRFEDLERDPFGQIRQIYAQLGLELSSQFQERLQHYLEDVAGYQKNRFHALAEDQQRTIDAQMGSFMARWGYDAGAPDHKAEKREAA